jgi:steroid delta-isomerase
MATIRTLLFAAIALLLAPLAACGPVETAETEIHGALTQWMADFNEGKADKVCNLFAPDLKSDFRGQPERNFDELCALLQKSLKDEARSFTYALDIKEILVSGDMAAVRLVWTLTVEPKGGGAAIVSAEPGLDIFRKAPNGSWKIARFLAFDED